MKCSSCGKEFREDELDENCLCNDCSFGAGMLIGVSDFGLEGAIF